MNNLQILGALIGVVVVFAVFKKLGQLSTQRAVAFLKQGATVIDVRSRVEFQSGHLPGVINVPLDEVETTMPQCVPDKSQALLLHCLSGMRSAHACRQFKRMGYANTFNLGSLDRAKSVLRSVK